MIEVALLGFLRQEPLHGYEIYQRLTEPNGLWLVWRIKQGRLYAMLDRLEAAGYVMSRLEPQHSRPPRKVLHMTADGQRVFEQWLRAPVEHGRELRLHFMLKLYFARREGEQAVMQLVSAQQAACRNWLQAEIAELDAAEQSSFSRLVHQFRVGQTSAMMTWLEHCLQHAATAATIEQPQA